MAFTTPETLSARSRSATWGERHVFVALRDYLPEDYLVYYSIAVQARYPDFICAMDREQERLATTRCWRRIGRI